MSSPRLARESSSGLSVPIPCCCHSLCIISRPQPEGSSCPRLPAPWTRRRCQSPVNSSRARRWHSTSCRIVPGLRRPPRPPSCACEQLLPPSSIPAGHQQPCLHLQHSDGTTWPRSATRGLFNASPLFLWNRQKKKKKKSNNNRS